MLRATLRSLPVSTCGATGVGAALRASATPQLPLLAKLALFDGRDSTASSSALHPCDPARRQLHTTARSESTLLVGGLAIAAGSIVAVYGLKAYDSWQSQRAAAQPPSESETGETSSESKTEANGSASSEEPSGAEAKASTGADAKKEGSESTAKPASSSMFGGQAFARRFYKGGFEDKMSKREASLILGVRCVMCCCQRAGQGFDWEG